MVPGIRAAVRSACEGKLCPAPPRPVRADEVSMADVAASPASTSQGKIKHLYGLSHSSGRCFPTGVGWDTLCFLVTSVGWDAP